MKKIFCSGKTAVVFVSLLFGALLLACDQEPLFWDIAHEYPPISPDVGGRPTRIVEIEKKLYVSNNSAAVWVYDAGRDESYEPFWEKMTGNDVPPFRVGALAAAGTELFALDLEGTTIWKNDLTTSGWGTDPIFSDRNIEKLFGAGNYLFVSVRTGSLDIEYGYEKAYTIKCLDRNGKLLSEKADTGLLMGAAEFGGTIYLATLGDGLHSVTGAVFGPADTTTYENTIIGLTVYNGNLFIVTDTDLYCHGKGRIIGGTHFTGAVAGWTDGTNHLLLAGLQYSSGAYGYGYREIHITPSGTALPGFGFEIPGEEDITSTDPESQYVSAIGKHAINYFHVMNDMKRRADPDNRPVIFACTFKSGLWSYRTRSGEEPQWNGEDRTGY